MLSLPLGPCCSGLIHAAQCLQPICISRHAADVLLEGTPLGTFSDLGSTASVHDLVPLLQPGPPWAAS